MNVNLIKSLFSQNKIFLKVIFKTLNVHTRANTGFQERGGVENTQNLVFALDYMLTKKLICYFLFQKLAMAEAWVTLSTNDSYCAGALTLAASLRRVGTSRLDK